MTAKTKTSQNLDKLNLITICAPKRLDTFTAPCLYEDLVEKICKGAYIVLDLSQTQFVDPVGADVIKEGLLRCKQHRAHLSLRGVKPQVKSVLHAGGVLQYFKQQARKKSRKKSSLSPQNVVRSQAKAG